MPMDAHSRIYPETRFGGFSRRDGTIAFYTRVNALVTPTSRVLDYGCGVGAHVGAEDPFTGALQRLRGKVAEVVGVDVDGAARNNPNIDRFFPTSGGEIPLEATSVDVCVCDWGMWTCAAFMVSSVSNDGSRTSYAGCRETTCAV